MKKNWSIEELEEFWAILPEERDVISLKQSLRKFFFVLVLKFYLHARCFPTSYHDIPPILLEYGYKQFGIAITKYELESLLLNVRNYNRYKNEIREFLGVKLFRKTEQSQLAKYLYKLTFETKHEVRLIAEAKEYLWQHKIELPAENTINHIVKSACDKSDSYLFQYINKLITSDTTDYIDGSILGSNEQTGETVISFLKQDSGKSNRDSIALELSKLQILKGLNIKESIIPDNISTKALRSYKRRILSHTPQQIRQKPKHIRYPLVIIFCYLKQQEIIDNLADHLINFVHKIKSKADKTEAAINSEIGKLSSGLNALYTVAEIAGDKPSYVIQDAIYPVVPRSEIDTIIKARYLMKTLKSRVRDKTIQTYSTYYRRRLFEILTNLEIKSNNAQLMVALEIIKQYRDDKRSCYPLPAADIPVDVLISKNNRDFIFEEKVAGVGLQINRKDYEYAIFKYLRDSLKTKTAWAEGALKYRNPDYDIPKDFEANKEYYYSIINQPLSEQIFIDKIQDKLSAAINDFDYSLPQNKHVKIVNRKGKPWIKLSPLQKQPGSKNLDKLKNIISAKWKVINLLDILKEVDLRENFTKCFTSAGNREIITPDEIRKRLILCLFAIGTNTGLTRVSSAYNDKISFEELRHIKRQFINQEDLRESITKVVNAIFRIRNVDIWGTATTACASDSKKFTSWDQNLMTEWHARYKGAGVMIYWHVSAQSICIYSQLKTCSSSEVASMLQGALSQETDMSVEAQYTDSHGKSECGFAITYLLGFDLLPRYKDIGRQKIYLPYDNYSCKNIASIATRTIKWELISAYYNEMIKYAVALKIGTATADSVIRQFSRTNYQHPVFKALVELGKAVKSSFLCRYLGSIELRQEIHSALNIVENWNSVNHFIFYGKGGEINSNSRDEQEYSMLCLHLLQVCLAYVNTLLIQDILKSKDWRNRLTAEDLRALTPLFYQHINPYGTFELDMTQRILVYATKTADALHMSSREIV